MLSARESAENKEKFTVRRDARRSGRMSCEDLRSNLGKILDLSSRGCRVLYRGWGKIPVGYAIALRLEGYDSSITVEAEIMRVQRRGFFTSEIGLRFVRLSDTDHACITALARNHSQKYLVFKDAS